MATDGRRLVYNPAFVEKLAPAELEGVLAHEVMHVALAHHCRRGERDTELWNRAADYAINPILINSGITLPNDALIDAALTDLAAEEIYSRLRKHGQNSGPAQPPSQSSSLSASARQRHVAESQGDLKGGSSRPVRQSMTGRLFCATSLQPRIHRITGERHRTVWNGKLLKDATKTGERRVAIRAGYAPGHNALAEICEGHFAKGINVSIKEVDTNECAQFLQPDTQTASQKAGCGCTAYVSGVAPQSCDTEPAHTKGCASTSRT
jgi:hypothetical protein